MRGPADTRGNKDAIDRLYKRSSPDYIMILGAPDVVPHIKVTNLTHDEDGQIIDSDLPYACDTRFHRDARRFLAPTRVVGRLPDINGGRDPQYLVGLLETATHIVRRPRTDYAGLVRAQCANVDGILSHYSSQSVQQSRGADPVPADRSGQTQDSSQDPHSLLQLSWECGIACLLGRARKRSTCRLSQQQYSRTTLAGLC